MSDAGAESLDHGSPETLNPRQSDILARVRAQGFVTIETLARDFGVSAQTVRRDIIDLDARGMLRRFHGGAGPPGSDGRLPYDEKKHVSMEAKAALARRAMALVHPGASLFLDVGTTCEALARALLAVPGLRVVTPSLAVALTFAGHDTAEVFVPGGTLRAPDGSLVGDETRAAVARFRFDIAFIGLSGFDDDGAPMDFDLHKVAVKAVAVERAESAVLLADGTKLDRTALVRIADLARFDALVTDRAPPEGRARLFAKAGVDVLVAA